jgi:hypothetical protein
MAVRELPFRSEQDSSSFRTAQFGSIFESNTADRSISVFFDDSTPQQEVYVAVHPLTGQIVQIDPDQRWFWTEEWLAKELEAEQALRDGEYEDFDDMDDFLATL